MNRTHELVLASAGTGKTWRLARRYLELLFAGVPPERILATTFTRKAAGEILDRVLQRLRMAAEDKGKLDELRSELARPDLSTERVLDLLCSLVRRLDRMQVSTLDAYFAKVAGAFGLDLGLPPAWSIVDDDLDEELHVEALSRTLASADRDQVLELLADLQRSAASRGVHKSLLKRVRAGREHAIESEHEAWDRIDVPPGPQPAELERARAFVLSASAPKNKNGQSANSNWSKALANLAEILASRDWSAFVDHTLVDRVSTGELEYSTHAIPEPLAAEVRVLLRQAARELVAELVRENRASRGLFTRFERCLSDLRRERGLLGFSDLPLAIAPPGAQPFEERQLELAWRLDARADHLLLDEFQDTSPPQWRCLAPLAVELLADGTGERSFFCVGDAKQSIYGWRGGEPELLTTLDARYPVLAPATELHASWRSSQVVLDTVNRVFGALGENAVFASARGGKALAARRFQARYPAHTAQRELPGAALLLETGPIAKGEDPDAALIALAVARVRELHACPQATIAVLLRRKKWIPRLIRAFTERSIPVSVEGGNPLTDSAAVLEVLSLLHLADHPGDSAAAFHVAHAALAAVVGVPCGDEAGAVRAAREVRRAIADRGHGAWLAGLLPGIRAAQGFGAWDVKRCVQLVELGLAFDARPSARTAEFVRHVRRTRVESPSASRVKLMTVHAAKGLEFDAVVLPELDRPFTNGGPAKFVWQRARPDGPITRISRRADQKVMRLHPLLVELAEHADAREMDEELAVLYVALTRARQRLEMIVQYRNPSDEPRSSCAGILRRALGNQPLRPGVLWEHAANAQAWFTPVVEAQEAHSAPAPSTADDVEQRPLRFAPSKRAHGATTRSASAQAAGPSVRAASILRAVDRAARARGTLVHRWLAEIEWWDGAPPPEARLRALAREVEHDPRVVADALAELAAALARPALRALLARPTAHAGEEHEVWRERRYAALVPDAAGVEELWQGAFDRVVLVRRAGRPCSAELIDWKSDVVTGPQLAQRVEEHRPQLHAYRRVLAQLTGLAEAQIRPRIAFLHAGEIVDAG